MVIEVIVLGHKIFTTGLKVDKAKFVVLKTLMPPDSLQGQVGVRNKQNL